MSLVPAPITARPAIVADWLEIRTFGDKTGFFRVDRIKRYWDTNRASEDADSEGNFGREDDTDDQGVSGGDADAFLDAVTEEISDRSKALGPAYPFYFNEQGTQLRLKDDWNEGMATYLFCLLLSQSKPGEVLTGTWLPSIDNVVRDLFQVCSTLAAAGEITGCAVSFGWPRPDENLPFLAKLKQVYALFGEGAVVENPRPGASPHVKDEEIDVIAWRPQNDGAAGTIYLLGQVASGNNWESKSIKGGPIDYFHSTWFEQRPPSVPIPSIFIPHSTPELGSGSRKDRMALIVEKYGTVLDRLRLPLKALQGAQLADQGHPHILIERRNEMQAVFAWVNEQRTGLIESGNLPL